MAMTSQTTASHEYDRVPMPIRETQLYPLASEVLLRIGERLAVILARSDTLISGDR